MIDFKKPADGVTRAIWNKQLVNCWIVKESLLINLYAVVIKNTRTRT